jgi:hypothetical protein
MQQRENSREREEKKNEKKEKNEPLAAYLVSKMIRLAALLLHVKLPEGREVMIAAHMA